jgi:hypothetical protein
MGFSKTLCKMFNSSEQAKEAIKTKCRPDAKQIRSQSTLSSRQLRRNFARPMKPETPAIPTQNVYRILSRECLRFDDAITKTSLSHVMLWYVYWDIVEMPVDSEDWYKDYGDQDEMFGWIRLGYEMDQFGLQSPQGIRKICAELGIDVADVRRRLTRMSKARVMTKTEIAEYGMDFIMGASFYMRKLSKDKALVNGLQPDPHTRWTRVQSQILGQLDLYQETLLQPAIQGGLLQRPRNIISAQRRNQARTDWNRLGGVRPLPSQSIYQRVLSPSGPDSGSDSKKPHSSNSKARESASRPRFADKFPDEQSKIVVDRKLNDSLRLPSVPLDDLTNLANHMNTQMTTKLDALASTLIHQLSQLQDEIIRQLRDQWQQNLAAAIQQLQDANHVLVETGLPSSVVASSNTTPIAAQYPTHHHYHPPKDQPLEPFRPFETQHEINLPSESYRHENPHVGANSRRFVRNASASRHNEMPSLNDSAYGSPTVTTQDEDGKPTITVQSNERISMPSEIRASGGVAHGSCREGNYKENELPGQAVLRATKAVLEAKRKATVVE